MGLKLTILEGQYSIHRLSPGAGIPEEVFKSPFYSITRTCDELSVVCPSSVRVASEKEEAGWACIKIVGPLAFSLTGILAEMSSVLARAKLSIFALSTFDTDYILVKSIKTDAAIRVLKNSGYTFIE